MGMSSVEKHVEGRENGSSKAQNNDKGTGPEPLGGRSGEDGEKGPHGHHQQVAPLVQVRVMKAPTKAGPVTWERETYMEMF